MTAVGDLSEHFSAGEFADRVTGHLLPPPPQLLQVLERIRAITGRPLAIVSGHRCCERNKRVGGADRSRHIYGDAADIPAGRATPAQARSAGATGIGVRDGWAVHVDVRPGPPTTWSY